MVEITLQRRPKIKQHKHKVVSKRCKCIKGKQYIIQAKRDNSQYTLRRRAEIEQHKPH
jgi:hypothetical protein